MDNRPLNASVFEYSIVFYNKDFEDILAGIIAGYYCIIAAKTPIPPNDENTIRDVLLSNYLKKTKFKETHPPLSNYLFDKEISENDGRVDIRIMPIKSNYIDDESYYNIECKRLDAKNQLGKTGLNGEYISNGIARFTSKKYTSYKNTAGLIGFVVEKMDIQKNIEKINKLLATGFSELNTTTKLTQKQIVSVFEYSYFSIHKVNDSSNIIYHLMLNFSDNTIAPKGIS
ncbi:MAG: hypothetical protein LBU51_06510 [Bacteroidales bacterium]|nr:hypothetical protein [Bacteroidales bacterium]